MRCLSCKSTMPFIDEEPFGFDCIYCAGRQVPDAADMLSQSALGFVNETRPGQISLASDITDGIRDESISIYEAGTGVGKSFAYLLPAILSGKRTVISTAKKTLQDQLLQKDLPYIKQHLARIGHPKATYEFFGAYGKSNYGCYLRCKREKGKTNEWPKYEKFFEKTEYGRWEEGEKFHLKLDQSLNAEDCIGALCSYHKTCQYIKAKNKVTAANVVVTNNWLLGYHYKILNEMGLQLLGSFDHLIVDEAHKVEDGIRAAFTYETKLDQLVKIKRSFEDLSAYAATPVTMPAIEALNPAWEQAFDDLLALNQKGERDLTPTVATHIKDVVDGLDAIKMAAINRSFLSIILSQVPSALHTHLIQRYVQPVQGSVITKVTPTTTLTTAAVVVEPIELLLEPGTVEDAPKSTLTWSSVTLTEEDQQRFNTLEIFLDQVHEAQQTFDSLLTSQQNRTWTIDKSDFKGKTYVFLKSMPVNIGGFMPKKAVTYLSATLALDGNFDDFAKRTGVTNLKYNAGIYPSPFNFQKQAHLYAPKITDMPIPDTQGGAAQTLYRDRLGSQILGLITASQGDAFVLFSSRAEMKSVQSYLMQNQYPYPVLSQDDFTPAEVLTRFRNTPQATLLGLKSFWEGVDVPGDKLFLVIITKLPFPQFNDPIARARKAAMGDGPYAFNLVDVPDMLFELRQGVGRLIRTQNDRGVIAILDSRIHTKPYGKKVLRAIGLQPHIDFAKVCKGIATRHAGRPTP